MTRRASRAGTTAVEFAAIGSALLLVMLFAIDLGRLYLTQQALNHGVAAAVRYAAVNSAGSSSASVASHVTSGLAAALGAAGAGASQVTVSFTPANAPGGSVTVQASLAWQPFVGLDLLPALTLTSADSLTIQH